MRSAGSFRMKVVARDATKGMDICECIVVSLAPPAARGRGKAGDGGVSCRVDEHFSHFFPYFYANRF